MRDRLIARLAALLGASLLALPAAAAPAARDSGFCQAIVDADYRLPAGESAASLTDELIGLLGSRDPVLRDRYGYEIFAAWIYRDGLLAPAELEAARRRLCDDARTGLGDIGADSVLRRSFSLLDLSVLAAFDLKKPFMSNPAFEETLGAAITALALERDLRGHESGVGWVHATAHAADLLKFLARSPRLTPDGQRRVVAAVRDRLQSAGLVFAWGEDARLAAALLSVLRRPDADPDALRPWLAALPDANRALWSGDFDPVAYATVRAQVNALTQLVAMLGRTESSDRLAAYEHELQETLAAVAL